MFKSGDFNMLGKKMWRGQEFSCRHSNIENSNKQDLGKETGHNQPVKLMKNRIQEKSS